MKKKKSRKRKPRKKNRERKKEEWQILFRIEERNHKNIEETKIALAQWLP